MLEDDEINRLRDSVRKQFPPPVMLLLFLLFDMWNSWPTINHPDYLMMLSFQSGTAIATGGVSVYLVFSGLLKLINNKTTLNALKPEHTRTLVIGGCYRFSRNPVYLGFVGLHLSTALLLGSLPGMLVTPFLVLLLTTLHIRVEEASMQRLFGHQWDQYCNRTPRWFSCVSLLRNFS